MAALVAMATTADAGPLPAGHLHAIDSGNRREELEKRITQGQNATYGDHPYICSLRTGGREHDCGAIIYNENTLLTAAHCLFCGNRIDKPIDLTGYVAWCGEHRLKEKDLYEQERTIAGKTVHPGYDALTVKNDIAILQLSSPLVFNTHVAPLPLDDGTVDLTGPCTLSGWGRTDPAVKKASPVLKDVSVSLVTNELCQARWAEYNYEIYDENICLGENINGADSCRGDSGGPAVCNGVIVGITSWGFPNCNSSFYPSVYTRVSKYYDWILENSFSNGTVTYQGLIDI